MLFVHFFLLFHVVVDDLLALRSAIIEMLQAKFLLS